MIPTSLCCVRPFTAGEIHGVTRHHNNQGQKTVMSSTILKPHRCVVEEPQSHRNYERHHIDYQASSLMGHIVNNIEMPLNSSKRHRKALAVMNSQHRKDSRFTQCNTVVNRMSKSSSIAQRVGTGSGSLSACNPSNSDAPFGDPHRQT